MSSALVREARTEAAAAQLEASASQGSSAGTPNTQFPGLPVNKRSFGTTAAAGATFVAQVPIPLGHTGTIEIVATGRVTIAGGTDVVGDSYSLASFVAYKNVAGTTVVIPNVSGTSFVQADTSQAADTITPSGNADGTVHITATQVGGTNTGTVDWTIDTITYID